MELEVKLFYSSGGSWFDWIFGKKIKGLITLYSGANSHMAIRSAELGLPTAIGIGKKLYDKLLVIKMLELIVKIKQ